MKDGSINLLDFLRFMSKSRVNSFYILYFFILFLFNYLEEKYGLEYYYIKGCFKG